MKQIGADKFAQEQYKKYHWSHCASLISTHNRKCFKCDRVTRLVEKRRKK